MKLLYITSSSFSGSTLLSFILNSNPDISTISEFDVMESIRDDPDYLCSCGSKLRECGFFNELKEQINKDGVEFELDDMDLMFNVSSSERINRYLTQKIPFFNSSLLEETRDLILNFIPLYRNRIESICYRNQVFMENVTKLQKGSVFLDANKNPYRLKYLSNKYDTTAIYLYKNGIAGAYSFYKASKNLDKNPITFEQACIRWFIEQITINRCLNGLKKVRKIDVSYTDLCSSTDKMVRDICDLTDISFHSIDNFQNVEHHIIGNVMRVSGINGIKESLDWKENLDNQDFKVYRKIYNKYIRRLEKENKDIIKNIWYED